MESTGKPAWQAPEITTLRTASSAKSGESTTFVEGTDSIFSAPSGPQ